MEPNDEESKKMGRVNKSYSQDESGSDEHVMSNINKIHDPSLSNTTSINSFATDVTGGGGGIGMHITDSLDMKIDCLLRDWHHSPDLLFSVHPIDGSFLIW